MKRVQLSLLLEPELEIEESIAEEPPIGSYDSHALVIILHQQPSTCIDYKVAFRFEIYLYFLKHALLFFGFKVNLHSLCEQSLSVAQSDG